MARAPDERVNKAKVLFDQGLKLIEIANQLELPEGTVRSWKNRYKWVSNDNATLQKGKRNVAKEKGGQPGNTNAVGHGAPEGNKNSEKHGFFAKWLPEETAEIMKAIEKTDPLDILWDNIQLQHTAIIRAQKLMYVKNQEDLTKELKRQKEASSDKSDSWEKEYELQFAWDKHATFMNAQSRAMKTLEGMLKQYDELLHKNWNLATEEQKARIALLKAKVNPEDNTPTEDDGFIEALQGKVDDIWSEE